MGADKIYEGTIRFGQTTNSYDADGEIVAELMTSRSGHGG